MVTANNIIYMLYISKFFKLTLHKCMTLFLFLYIHSKHKCDKTESEISLIIRVYI